MQALSCWPVRRVVLWRRPGRRRTTATLSQRQSWLPCDTSSSRHITGMLVHVSDCSSNSSSTNLQLLANLRKAGSQVHIRLPALPGQVAVQGRHARGEHRPALLLVHPAGTATHRMTSHAVSAYMAATWGNKWSSACQQAVCCACSWCCAPFPLLIKHHKA